MDKIIIDTYKKAGYPGKQKLYKILIRDGVKVTVKQVAKVIDAQISHQLHKKQPKKVKAHMVAFVPNQIWQIDLLDMSNYAKANKNYKWILLGIDVFSRKAYAEPLKNKTASDVLEGFKSIVKTAAATPQKLISDNGSEFLNKQFQDYLVSKKILHETNEPQYHPTLGIIDRLSRTIKERLFKYFTDLDSTFWLDKIYAIIAGYNATPHRSLGDTAPNDAIKNEEEIRQMNMQRTGISAHGFKIGMTVRTRLAKTKFSKGFKIAWSNELFTIKKISGVNAILNDGKSVKLNDLQQVIVIKEEPKNAVKTVEREVKIDRKLAQAGVSEKNITTQRQLRERRKPNPKIFKHFYQTD